MTDGNARENAREEARRGDEALAAARHLADGGYYCDAVSRAYFAAFHWARALLLSRGLDPRTHRGAVQLFGLHFVKNGPLSEDVAARLAHLETYRELSDYTVCGDFTAKQAAEEIERARLFIEACRPLRTRKSKKRKGSRG